MYIACSTGQNWLKFGDKIQIPSMITITMQVWSTIMGRSSRVVWGAYFQMVFRTDLAHFLYSIHSHTFSLDLILLCNLLLQKLGFSLFSNVQNIFPLNIGGKVPNLDMSCSNVMIQLTWCLHVPPNLESALHFIVPWSTKTQISLRHQTRLHSTAQMLRGIP